MSYEIVFVAPEQAELVAIDPDGKPLGSREVAGPTEVSLISTGTELNLYRGFYHQAGVEWGQLPHRPGYAAVFHVEDMGSDIDDINVDDYVFAMGCHRSWQRFQRDKVLKIPDGLRNEIALFARMMNITMSALTITTVRPPSKVLVTGLGVVGLLGAQIFDHCGYEVVAFDPQESRRTMARETGIRNVWNALPTEVDSSKEIALVLECSGNEQAILDSCPLITRGAEIIMVGATLYRKTDIYAQEILHRLFRKSAVLRGGSEWIVPMYPTEFRPNSIFGNLSTGLRWLLEGRLQVERLFRKVSPENPQQVYQRLAQGCSETHAVIFDWTQIE